MYTDLITRAKDELRARHVFFVDWFTGRADDAAMAETGRAFAFDMERISPDAEVMNRDQILTMLRGARAAMDESFSISIVITGAAMLDEQTARISYEEHQSYQGEAHARRSTAIFSADERAPGGALWRHVHETWIRS